ncbi:MAG TPA: hypothetical protein VKJ65_02785, partial [Phycisphaerae bacterium]|nr:hypothetical protein [Phycisphaerae bacterium]
FVPVIIQLSFLPFSFSWADTIRFSWMFKIPPFMIGVFLPLYLAVLGSIFILRKNGWWIFPVIFMVMLSALLSAFLNYLAWGISTHLLWTPDNETVGLSERYDMMTLVIAIAPPIFILLFRYVRLFVYAKPH